MRPTHAGLHIHRRACRCVPAALLLAVAACFTGCATLPPPAPRPTAPAPVPPQTSGPAQTPAPAPGSTVGATASGGTIRVNPGPVAPAVADSTPSAEAMALLGTIPEPLGTSAPETLAWRPGAPPTVARPPGNTAPTDADSASITEDPSVPVPAPTEPLGDRPGSSPSLLAPESLAVAAPALPPADTSASPAAPPAGPAASAPPDTCWRVQFSAPPEPERGDAMAKAVASQLLVVVVVEREGGLHKVRSRDCYTATAADDLKRRAVASGFEGAFRFRSKKP